MATRPPPHRRLTPAAARSPTPEAVAAALAPACHALERALQRAPPDLAPWRARLGPHADRDLIRGLAQAATHAALIARHHAPAGWLADLLADLRRDHADALAALERTVAALPPVAADAPGFHSFEHLLAACDAGTRDAAGAYYTPIELVDAQIALAGAALRTFEDRDWTHPAVRILDPACGTGTYALALAARTAPEHRPQLARNLLACEIHPGPAIVAHGHLAALLPDPQVTCHDTLLNPPPDPPPGATLVCIGNPPYSRHAPRGSTEPLLAGFLPPAGAGIHAKNLYNDYVYFWRWAAAAIDRTPGIVCFVTAASWLRGPGFATMRARLRAIADELWILDLGGDALGARRTPNIFNHIRVPVCIGMLIRRPTRRPPAIVRYTRLDDALGRADRLRTLSELRTFEDLPWTEITDPDGFVPTDPSTDPRLTDIFPWQHSGAQYKRTWPIGETPELLARRWRTLLSSPDRAAAFHETRDRTITRTAPALLGARADPPLADLAPDATCPPIVRYAWRSFDRRWCLADARLGDFLRPPLWRTQSNHQHYLTTLLSDTPSRGPAVVATRHVPDLHHFAGRGGADVLPLWRDAAATTPNITAGLLDLLARTLARPVDPDDLFNYTYACLAHPAYTATLREPGPRVPLTRDPTLFTAAVTLGRALLQIHTYADRTPGAARCTRPIGPALPRTFTYDPTTRALHLGDGLVTAIDPAVFTHDISGLKVVPAWLVQRMHAPRGRTSSPLDALRPAHWTDDLTAELLELLWLLERSLALHPRQAALYTDILAAPRLTASELPLPTPAERRPP